MPSWDPVIVAGAPNPTALPTTSCFGWVGTDEKICRNGDSIEIQINGAKRFVSLAADAFPAFEMYAANGTTSRLQFRTNSTPGINIQGTRAVLEANSGAGILRAEAVRIELGEAVASDTNPLTVPLENNSGAAAAAGDVGILNVAADNSWVTAAVPNSKSPLVVVGGGNDGAVIWVAIGGKVAVLECTAAAVTAGDTMVTAAIASQAMPNNAQTNPSLIIGHALTAKGAGAGPVAVLIQR